VVDAGDERRQFLAPVVVVREQIRLAPGGQQEGFDSSSERCKLPCWRKGMIDNAQ
jgi:hypothetical protein